MEPKLSHLYKQLTAFEFVQCGMHHERVQRQPGSEQPIRNASREGEYVRTQYCSSETRKNRLGCAHTMARVRFAEVLDQLSPVLSDQEQINQWKQRLTDLDFAIIQVDMQKSDAELAHAKLCEDLSQSSENSGGLRQKIDDANTHVGDLVGIHNGYVTQLKVLRDEVMEVLQSNPVRER